MKSRNGKITWTALSVVAVIGLLGASKSFALTCVPPRLDAAYESAENVFLARLVSASVSEDFSAQGEVVLDTALKGSPPEKLTIRTNIGPLTYCGPDLTIGQQYLVFLTNSKPRLVLANDPNVLQWIEKKLQTLGAR